MNKTECPICESKEPYLEYRGRKDDKCGKCGSTVRVRNVFLALGSFGLRDKLKASSLRIAHVAPERCLYNRLSQKGKNKAYESFDLYPEIYRFAKSNIKKIDLCDVSEHLSHHAYDLILHNHVIEHVPCSPEKVLLSLNRHLAPGGYQIFTLPVRDLGDDTKQPYLEDLNMDLSDEERTRRFAQRDHMRIFHAKYVENWVKNIFCRQTVRFDIEEFSEGEIDRYGVRRELKAKSRGISSGATVFFFRR